MRQPSDICSFVGWVRRAVGTHRLCSFLQTFDLAGPDEADGLAALALYRQFRVSHGIDWPDCQIAATALRLGVEVVTQNVKHFSVFLGLRVVRAY